MNIYLVGFMATGKSAVGKELAQKMNFAFLDLDESIELKQKRAIKDIFAREGESYFRELEKRELQEASCKDNLVVACGGGIVLDKDNLKIMQQTGRMICLRASVEVILSRAGGYSHRPLLNVKDPRARIRELLELRAPFYAQADYSIDTSELSIKEVAEKILQWIQTQRIG
jgi:shikimate kinase